MSLQAPLPTPSYIPPVERRGLFVKRKKKRGTLQFVDFAAQCDGPFPTYWLTPLGQQPRLFTGGRSRKKSIRRAVEETWDPNLVGLGSDARGLRSRDIEILEVYRLENPILFSRYFQERKKLFEECSKRRELCPDISQLPGSSGKIRSTEALSRATVDQNRYHEVNEQYLFHGTKRENVQSILTNGLNPSFSSRDRMFGQAIYTTECFTKADQYSDSPEGRTAPGTELYMILARVLLGRVYVCDARNETSRLKHLPHGFDSIMADGQWMFREFAVPQENRCYPEIVIKYKRKK